MPYGLSAFLHGNADKDGRSAARFEGEMHNRRPASLGGATCRTAARSRTTSLAAVQWGLRGGSLPGSGGEERLVVGLKFIWFARPAPLCVVWDMHAGNGRGGSRWANLRTQCAYFALSVDDAYLNSAQLQAILHHVLKVGRGLMLVQPLDWPPSRADSNLRSPQLKQRWLSTHCGLDIPIASAHRPHSSSTSTPDDGKESG